jgi:hypothetical protein
VSAATLAGELAQKAVRDLELRVIPWVNKRDGNAPCLAYNATVGVGKTGVIVETVAQGLWRGLRIAIRVPTVELASELYERLEAIVPGAVGLWRGREQSDPSMHEREMCRRAEDVKAAQFVGGSPSDVCGSKKRGYCPFHPDHGTDEPCGYKQQRYGHKQVVIFAGDSMLELAPREGMKRAKNWRPYKGTASGPAPDLFSLAGIELDEVTIVSPEPEPENTSEGQPDFDLLILDETEPLSMLEGFGAKPISLEPEACDEVVAALKCQSDREILSGFLDLFRDGCLSVGLGGFLAPLKPGEYYHDIRPDQILGSSWGEEVAICRSELTTHEFIDILETVRDVSFENVPQPVDQSKFNSMTAAEIKQANAAVTKARSVLLTVARVCEVMCIGLRNELQTLRHLKVASTSGSAYLRRKKPLSEHYDQIPTMIFDATLRPDLLRYTFERLEVAYQRHAADGDGVSRYQLRDRDLIYSTLEGPDWPPRVWLLSRLLTRSYGSTGLIIPKKVRDRLPENESADEMLGHFGALRGLNKFENVACLLVASRPAIGPTETEDRAAVLSGQEISPLPIAERWYPKAPSVIRWREDRRAGWQINHVTHPDPLVESVRAAVTEDALEQALGRGRNVRRARNRPLVEYVVTTTPTNRPVDGTFTMAELKAATGWVGVFLEMGVWFEGGSKGMGGVLHAIMRGLAAQRPESLYICLIGDPAFESAEAAADWRKKQLEDNPEISTLSREIDKALGSRADSIEIMCARYPLHDFTPIQAKVRGTRYFAQLYVRVREGQTAEDALTSLLGPLAGELEIRPEPTV